MVLYDWWNEDNNISSHELECDLGSNITEGVKDLAKNIDEGLQDLASRSTIYFIKTS